MQSRKVAVVSAVMVLVLTASGCGGSASPDVPRGEHGWAFDNGGAPDVGDLQLRFSGSWEQAEGAVSLDGATGSAESERPAVVETAESYTVAAWVSLPPERLRGQHVYAVAVSQAASVAAAFYLGVRLGHLAFTLKSVDTNAPGLITTAEGPAVEPDATRWVHLVGTYDAEAGEIRLHRDGRLEATESFDQPITVPGPLLAGRAQANGSPADFWPGAIADVRTFDRALSTAEVGALMEDTRQQAAPPDWPTVPAEVRALNGLYEYRFTAQESARLEELFGPEAAAAGFPAEATVRISFVDGLWQLYYRVNGVDYLVNGIPEGDGGSYRVEGDTLLHHSVGAAMTLRYRWSIDGDVLSLALLEEPPDADIVRFMTQREFVRVQE